ncbi:MAG: hypothetical protein ACKOQY_10180 [Bacteroidota bacterium]
MKNAFLLCLILGLITQTSFAQQAKKPAAKPQPTTAKAQPVRKLNFCTLPDDSSRSAKLPLTTIQDWANFLPLKVTCDNEQVFELKQFNFTVINKSPMQSRDFGIANNGIPILGRKAIDQMKPGDTVFMKDVSGTGKDGQEIKLPNIVFSVSE